VPLYWKQLQHVDSWEIVAHRQVWSLVALLLILAATGGLGAVRALVADPRSAALTLAAALLLATNWLVYVIGVNSGRVTECSLGYYLVPLVNVLAGRFVLHETLRPVQWLAIGSAAVGVVVLVVDLGGTRFVTRDADTALDGDRHLTVGAIRHGRAAIAHEVRLAHKRRAEAARASDALGRAANIEVDGSVTPRTGDHHGLPQHVRVGATELQHNGLRVVGAIVRQESRELGFAAVHDRVGGHHLRVQRGPSAEQAQHVPKETIRVVPETEKNGMVSSPIVYTVITGARRSRS
jgi:uncharacterized membrane protein